VECEQSNAGERNGKRGRIDNSGKGKERALWEIPSIRLTVYSMFSVTAYHKILLNVKLKKNIFITVQ
jgi:hypothetical protein